MNYRLDQVSNILREVQTGIDNVEGFRNLFKKLADAELAYAKTLKSISEELTGPVSISQKDPDGASYTYVMTYDVIVDSLGGQAREHQKMADVYKRQAYLIIPTILKNCRQDCLKIAQAFRETKLSLHEHLFELDASLDNKEHDLQQKDKKPTTGKEIVPDGAHEDANKISKAEAREKKMIILKTLRDESLPQLVRYLADQNFSQVGNMKCVLETVFKFQKDDVVPGVQKELASILTTMSKLSGEADTNELLRRHRHTPQSIAWTPPHANVMDEKGAEPLGDQRPTHQLAKAAKSGESDARSGTGLSTSFALEAGGSAEEGPTTIIEKLMGMLPESFRIPAKKSIATRRKKSSRGERNLPYAKLRDLQNQIVSREQILLLDMAERDRIEQALVGPLERERAPMAYPFEAPERSNTEELETMTADIQSLQAELNILEIHFNELLDAELKRQLPSTK